MNSVSPRSGHFPSFRQWSPISALAGGIFLIDLLIPLGVAAGVMYIAVILLSLRHQDSQLPIWSAAVCTILTIAALFISPTGGEFWKVLTNRGLALFVIWTTTLLGRIQLQQAWAIEHQDRSMQNFMNMLPSACFSFDRQGTILSWNPAAEKIYGYTEQEAVGASSYDLIVTPETNKETQNVIDKVFQGEATVNKVWHDQNKQGGLGWRAGSVFPVFSRNGQIAYGININIDITTQKTTETNLQNQKILIEAILDSSSDAIYAKNHEGKYLIVNQAAADAMGHTPESAIGLDDIQIFGSEHGSTLQKTDAKILSHGQSILLEESVVTGNKSVIFSTTKSPLKTSSGKTIGLVGISRDITQWKQTQLDLLLTDRVFMASNDHISILGHDYRYRRVNPSYEQVHGHTSQGLLGMSVSELLGQEVFEETVKPKLDQCFQGKEVHYEAWFRFADNQNHYMAVSYLPLVSPNNDIDEIVVIARDWTDRKEMEKILQANQQQLRTILDAMTNFVGIGTSDGIITDCNQPPLTLGGLTREDVIGKHFVDTHWLNYSPKTQEQVRGILQRVGQGEIVREDYQARMRGDLIVTVDACFVPVKDKNGQVQQIVHSGIDVTKRRQDEVALHASEEQFRDLYESAPLAYFSASWDGHITRVNRRASELLGYSEKEFIGKHVLTLYAPTTDGHQKASTIQKKTQEGTSVHDEELEMLRKDGSHLWVSLTVRLILDASGKIIERRGMAQDISSRKKIEGELRASEYRVRSLVETAGSIIIGLSSDGWIVEWNREAEHLYKKTREEVLDTNYFNEFIQETDRPHMLVEISRVLAGNPSRDYQNLVIDKNGNEKQVAWNIDRLLDEHDQPYGVICIGRDITEWEQAKETLQRQALMFNMLYDGVLITDIHGNITDWNPGAEEVFGYSKMEALGKTPAFLHQPSESATLTRSIIDELTQKGRWQGEINFLKKNGVSGVCETIVTPLKDSEGQLVGTIGVNRDITERKHTEKQLNTIAKGTSSSIGKEFFYSFVEQLTIALNVDYAIVGEYRQKDSPAINTIAAFGQGTRLDNFEYELLNTPCENVVDGSFYACPQEANQLFPRDMLLKDFDIQGYAGLPLFDSSGSVIGLILVLHQKPLQYLHAIESIMKIFAARAVAELERIHSEEARKQSEERFRTYFETGLVGMAMLSTEQKWLEINGQLCELLGYTREEIKKTTWTELTHPDDLLLDKKNITDMIANIQKSYSTSKRFIRKDGSLMYANLYVNACHDTSDQVEYFTAIIEDVTEQKQGEALLMKWAMIFQHTQWGVAVSQGTSTQFEMVNEAYARMHGYAIRELEGMSVTDVMTPEFRIKLPNTLEKIQQDGFLSYEARHIRKDGSTFPVLVTESAIKDINGQTLYRVTNVIDIADLKSAEEALKSSEERLSIALEATSSGTWDWNVQTGDVIFGKEWLTSLGYESQDLLPTVETWKNLVHPDDMPKTLEAIDKHFCGKTLVYESINRLRMKNGEWRWNMDRGRVVEWTTDGKPARMVGTDTDITARKEAEEALLQSERMANSTMNALTAELCVINESGQILTTNDRWDEFSRNSNGDLTKLGIGINYMDVCTVAGKRGCKEAELFLDGLKQVLSRQQKNFSMDYLCTSPSNQNRWYTVRISRFPDPGPLRAVIAHEDITALKQAQTTLSTRIEEVHDLYNNAPCGYHSLDDSGRYIEVNDTELKWLGYKREEVLGRQATEFLTTESQQRFQEIFPQYVVSGEISNLEAVYRRKDGTTLSTLVNATTVRNMAGEYVRSRATMLDISERKKFEEAIQQHNIELEEKVEERTIRVQELEHRRMRIEKLAALAQIAAGVAHEINNPLASISQSLVLLKRAIPTDHPHFRYMAKTEDCVQRIANITKRLYQLYRPSGPKLSPIDLRLCIQTAMDIMEEQALKHDIQIEIPNLPNPIMMLIAEGELIQVLCNLLHNAIDATDEKGTIDINLNAGLESLTLSVKDQGEGIPPEAVPHVFEPFFTTKTDHVDGGMGLGLSISHSLIESMGGALDFSTSLGHGSTFTITLPRT